MGKGRKVSGGVTRRSFLKVAGSGAALTEVLTGCRPSAEVAVAEEQPQVATKVSVTLRVNGKSHRLQLEPRVTLLNALRHHLHLTGAKPVCDRGECGACTVLMDGKPIYSCMLLAVDADGHEITTVEGLAQDGRLHPLQAAFVEKDALQCGFCTPGFIMAALGLLRENKNPTLEQVRAALSGNICRCGVYTRIFEAVLEAAKKMQGRA
ncbi:MAG: (2Fe-2S)-binding protein [Armatimonadetes bacterium]|nr:(2Fe-2S)-binding protein [Armatimonadota bacterium]MDW8120744.1 (2Fe-2S)-binding protein [Armatimonadota bacterium]